MPRGGGRKADSVALTRSPAAHALPAVWEEALVLGEEGEARPGRTAAAGGVAAAAAAAVEEGLAQAEGVLVAVVVAGDARDEDVVAAADGVAAGGTAAAAAAGGTAAAGDAAGAGDGGGGVGQGRVGVEEEEERQCWAEGRSVSWSPFGHRQGGRQAMRSRLSYDVVGTPRTGVRPRASGPLLESRLGHGYGCGWRASAVRQATWRLPAGAGRTGRGLGSRCA